MLSGWVVEMIRIGSTLGNSRMTHSATVTYSRGIIWKAVSRFWVRFIAWHGFAAIGICVVGCLGLLLAGNRSWLVGALGAVGVMLMITAASVYVVFLRRSLWKFDRMSAKSVAFQFSDEGFSSVSDLGSSTLSWRAVEKVWRFSDVWLLFVGKTIYITLPIAEVDEATRTFITNQVAQHGGRVA
jgi:hypothetical protein